MLENTLDESSKIKNMSDQRLGCLTKSLLSQDFYRMMSNLSKNSYFAPCPEKIKFQIYLIWSMLGDAQGTVKMVWSVRIPLRLDASESELFFYLIKKKNQKMYAGNKFRWEWKHLKRKWV